MDEIRMKLLNDGAMLEAASLACENKGFDSTEFHLAHIHFILGWKACEQALKEKNHG